MKYETAKKRRRVHQSVEMFEILNKETVRETIRELTDEQAAKLRQTLDAGAGDPVEGSELESCGTIHELIDEQDAGIWDPVEGDELESESDQPVAVTPRKVRAMKTRIAARQKCWEDADEDTRKAVLDAIEEERRELKALKAEEPGLDKKTPRELQE